jgi:hypothetical protein
MNYQLHTRSVKGVSREWGDDDTGVRSVGSIAHRGSTTVPVDKVN